MEYTDYAPDLSTGEQIKQGFACSAVRNGNFYLDYSDVPEFVIKVAAKESEGRYVLDHAKSAAHGVELLKDMDIYGGYGPCGLHWMLSDEKETYIIECIDGELVARNDTDNIMTYAPNTPYAKHIAKTGQTVAGKVYEGFPILTPHACGVERYAILKGHYAEGAESAEGMSHLMERVKYTQAYEADTEPFWYTEFAGGLH